MAHADIGTGAIERATAQPAWNYECPPPCDQAGPRGGNFSGPKFVDPFPAIPGARSRPMLSAAK